MRTPSIKMHRNHYVFAAILLISIFTFNACTTTTKPPETKNPTPQTKTTPEKTSPKNNKPTETPEKTKTEEQFANWETESNNAYKFEIKHPTDWTFTQSIDQQVDEFFITKGESLLAILPKGGYGFGLPQQAPTTLNSTLAGKPVKVQEWSLPNNQQLKMYYFTADVPSGWTVCQQDLKNCNRIQVFVANEADSEVLQNMLSTFKFQS